MDAGFREKVIPVETFYIFIDSRYRDKTTHISPSQYVIDFENVFKNVISVELVHAIYGKTGLVDEKYVNLHIEELNPNVISHINSSKGAFSQLPFYKAENDLYQYDKQSYQSIRKFDKPLMKLSKLSFTFLDKDDKLFPMTEHMLRFEVTCFKLNENIEEWDNFRIITNSVRSTEPTIKKDPYVMLGLQPNSFDLNLLVLAFREKAKVLRKDGYTKNAYDELKAAFSQLAQTISRT